VSEDADWFKLTEEFVQQLHFGTNIIEKDVRLICCMLRLCLFEHYALEIRFIPVFSIKSLSSFYLKNLH
jgi:hypothetical protein